MDLHTSADENTDLPSVEELRREVEAESPSKEKRKEEEFEHKFSSDSVKQEADYARIKGIEQHYLHKGYWSIFIMLIMFIMIVFQCVLLGMVGGNTWRFSQYKWLLPTLMVQNLAELVGLAFIVVRSLFRDIKS
ncbi:hypothetical protein ACWM9A_13420 [Acetobacter pasteurianus]